MFACQVWISNATLADGHCRVWGSLRIFCDANYDHKLYRRYFFVVLLGRANVERTEEPLFRSGGF